MGYFPNGTAGDMYQAKYCDHCVHWVLVDSRSDTYGCPCLDAHAIWNYEECNKEDSVLHKMIPRDHNGFNEECLFFRKKVD